MQKTSCRSLVSLAGAGLSQFGHPLSWGKTLLNTTRSHATAPTDLVEPPKGLGFRFEFGLHV